ncbi:TetR family transcriptional regulator [Halopolyspora algeriensis]|uniref:TetR family transcriptional regulator n=1 Tax=Halopolyspora algeriensis TaxID=1500506 RepID=A0A368VEQ0_9ACTN|nr:TetR/AcrR family transcriptional regulator [Halopolyspora algeriensis]RCW37481.1 TetR family transcriptional regulator [Halopolyspora algeriensis]TQM42571.1 TetR family transcriptional regulator [Halopolyspora algeriensis]
MATVGDVSARAGPRERILDTAYALFARRGVGDVGVDEVIAGSGVAKATLYRHFPSKTELVLAFLAEREQRWTREFIAVESARRGATPQQQLLALFDVFDEWFHRTDFEGCSFINVLLEMHGHGPEHPLGRASAQYLDNIRALVRQRAERAGLTCPAEFAHSWHILMKGSIVAAAEGDRHAARRAKPMAHCLIQQHSTT